MNAAVSKANQKKTAAPKLVAPPPSKPNAKESAIQIVESGSCPSLTGKSTLGFDVGKDASDALYLRIRSNSGNGRFSKDFFPLHSLMGALEKAEPPITSGTLRTVCRWKSANQGPFLLAVFAHKAFRIYGRCPCPRLV